VAVALGASTARALGLEARIPWHTTRSPVTAVGDALVTCTDAWGHLASDVATLSRPEIGELAEGRGGGSSTMPHKQNPVLSILVRRAALTTPQLAASLHLASAGTVDERPDGAWHAEWATLRDLARRAMVAGSQTADLVAGLRVDTERMRATLDAAVGLYAEQGSMARVAGGEPSGPYLGATDLTITAVLTRARTFLEETA
jgi:3-carboxy-cis,cis-muconate cycloisomerase